MNQTQLKPSVVLVADRTLSADYKALFEGIFATMQTTKVPELAMRRFVAPPVRTDSGGRAVTMPVGLRRVEASLMTEMGLSRDEVVCTTPEAIGRLMGPWVKVVGFSSSDPMGMGMSNTTTTNFWSGELYTRYFTRQQLGFLLAEKQKYGFQVIGGGGGAWQWPRYGDDVSRDCLDCVYEGYFEDEGVQLFKDAIDGKAISEHIVSKATGADAICPIRGASMMGIIELSRGCGRGCRFCTIANKKMEHLPHDVILSDLETNVSNGIGAVVSGSEDFFRYGATGLKPDFEKLRELLVAMKQIKGLSFMQVDHANVTSVVQMTDEQLKEIRRLLTWEKQSKYLWVNMGAESANGHLVAQSCPGKVAPYRPEDWEGLLYETAERMTRNDYFGVYSLVLGLPGETGADVTRTLKLVKFLEHQNAVVFPVFYEPYLEEEVNAGMRFTLKTMRRDHLELYQTCYEINFRKVPLLFWDNQRCGGVSWAKRVIMRLLGKGEIIQWRGAFKRVGRQIDARQHSKAG
ncbi:MAG: radical SAM protein [Phycisphaerae bacterium]|nr:radical SAM protein [Phycisphaerae bacterium]